MAPYNRSFFALQIDFAHAITKHYHIDFTDALFNYTSFYTRVIGFSGTYDQSNPIWLAFLDRFPTDRSQQLEYVYQQYLAYEKQNENAQQKPNNQVRIGCFSYEYMPETNKFGFHFTNADKEGNLSRNRMEYRTKELRELFSLLKKEQKPDAHIYITSWLLNLDAFNRLLPPALIQSRTPRNKGLAQDNGWWGQFLDRRGEVKEELAQQLREKMTSHFTLIDEYFPLRTLRAEASQQDFYDFYRV